MNSVRRFAERANKSTYVDAPELIARPPRNRVGLQLGLRSEPRDSRPSVATVKSDRTLGKLLTGKFQSSGNDSKRACVERASERFHVVSVRLDFGLRLS